MLEEILAEMLQRSVNVVNHGKLFLIFTLQWRR